LGESRLVDVELDADTKLDATEVTSAELISGVDLRGEELAGNTLLAGGSARKTQQRRVDVGGTELAGNTGLSGRSARGACRRRAKGGWGMAVTCAERVGARVRDAEEMHKLHDILLLPVALNRETEERDEIELERVSLSGHLST
jgi:hypothetical protein